MDAYYNFPYGVFRGLRKKSPEPSPFHPPNWIWGEWSDEPEPESAFITFIFTSNNIIMRGKGVYFNFKEALKNTPVEETITDTLYKVSIDIENNTVVYEFKKINGTTIQYTAIAPDIPDNSTTLIKL
ncbi:MAG: hypothetical protein GX050_05880 [Firmicutes bacterium]|nr:hypothetical protein [Bacillota bacterium]